MNHYLKNIAAKNLSQMEVIQPRLASRFEPTPHHTLPVQRGLQTSVSDDLEPANAIDLYSQDHDASDHYSPDRYTRVTARNIVRSPAHEAHEPDLPGHEPLAETESAGDTGRLNQQYRRMPPISETKKSFSSSGEGEMPASLETDRQTSSPPEEMISGRQSIFRSSGEVSPPQTAPAPGLVPKVTVKVGPERQPPLREPVPFDSVEEEQIPVERSYDGKLIKRGMSESQRPEKIVPLSAPEEKQFSLELNPNLNRRAVDRPASRIMPREEEISPIASIEKNEKKIGNEYGIRQRNVEPIAGIKPLMPSASPGIVAARPYVKSYFGPKRNEISEKVAKPETSAPVQVTIGRIEIRATPATATPQRKRADPPVMSLEDYLKNKRGSL